ncbi:MAG: SDR family oxidoreductase [Caldicoprobacterales bacterium]
MENLFDLSGKTAVITGGTGVLCSQMAIKLAACGVKAAVLGLDEDQGQLIARQIRDQGGQAIGLVADVLDKESLNVARDIVLSEFGSIDILINGAGGNKKEASCSADLDFFSLPQEALEWVFNLNFLGTILSCQVFGQPMVDQKKGSIINISSMASFRPLTNVLAYGGAKAAINNFTSWLAVHLNHNYSKDIRVNAIAPGFFLTKQNEFLLVDEETGQMTERGKRILDHTPMARFGTPEDLLGAVLYLASEASSFVNGTVIPIDGGFSAYAGV